MRKKITIAIDGYSSTGKSTIAKELANKLGYVYVDTGAMYRMVSLFAMQNDFINAQVFLREKLIASLEAIELNFVFSEEAGFAEAYLNGACVEKEIRSLEVSNYVSKVASVPEVRKKLVSIQKQLGKNKGVVMDGRDIGTVVFPDAELKLFMTASSDKRAQRRFDELISKGEDVRYDAILENVVTRDYEDSNRKDSPLVKASDAVEIDNSDLTKEAQFSLIFDLVTKKLEQ
jgi:cytidylate kinase